MILLPLEGSYPSCIKAEAVSILLNKEIGGGGAEREGKSRKEGRDEWREEDCECGG